MQRNRPGSAAPTPSRPGTEEERAHPKSEKTQECQITSCRLWEHDSLRPCRAPRIPPHLDTRLAHSRATVVLPEVLACHGMLLFWWAESAESTCGAWGSHSAASGFPGWLYPQAWHG